MIVELKKNATRDQIEMLENWLTAQGIRVTETQGEEHVVLGLVGKAAKKIDEKMIESLEIVESTNSVKEPFKRANRKFHPEDSIIDINGVKIGGGNFAVIAGPCSVESPEQITEVARAVQASGATLLRGGAFKPRTSPYDFQGMKAEGLELLELAKADTGMPLVTEIMNAAHLPLFENVEVLQVGARNMQNFELLKAVGRTNKTILLKRGLANTLKELLMSAEYIMSEGNPNVILCERGIRTFETHTRNTLDLSAVPALKELSHLPVVIDPSHATGIARMVEPMAMAAAAAGADGLMIEVHNDPAHALCDGPQSLTPAQFDRVMKKVNIIREAMKADI